MKNSNAENVRKIQTDSSQIWTTPFVVADVNKDPHPESKNTPITIQKSIQAFKHETNIGHISTTAQRRQPLAQVRQIYLVDYYCKNILEIIESKILIVIVLLHGQMISPYIE
jgi:hypothetical protein